MEVAQRAKICRLIEGVIAADGVIRPEEREFLHRVSQRFGIVYEIAEAGPVCDVPMSDPGRAARVLRELEPDVQTRVMALLVESAVTDGEVAPHEHALLLVAAAALNIDASVLEERIHSRLQSVLNRL